MTVTFQKGDYLEKDPESSNLDDKLINLLEKQKKELVIRTLQKHEEIKTEKAFTDKLIASLSDILIICNNEMEVIKVNREFTKHLGYKIDRSGTLHLRDMIPNNSFAELKQLILSGEFKHYETELITRSGRKFLASLNGSTLANEKSGSGMYIIIAKDKTEVYEMMSRVRESQSQLLHSGRLASLGEMAAGIAHELTQPLNAILLFARNSIKNLSDQGIRNEMLEENLSLIVDRVKKASSIIKSLKGFARKSAEEKVPININLLISDVMKFFENQLRLSDVEIDLDLDQSLPDVIAHNVRIEQVFLNILQNALQAMDHTDTPRLTIRTYVEQNLSPDNLKPQRYIAITITDNGEGMSAETRQRIFDPFFTTREVGSGTGLGLSIVDRIMRDHSGYIWVDSSPGYGSCFSLYLPVQELGNSEK